MKKAKWLILLLCLILCFTGCQNEQEADYGSSNPDGCIPNMWQFSSFSQIREFAAAANEGEYAFRTFLGESDTGLWENYCCQTSTALSFMEQLKTDVLPHAKPEYQEFLTCFEYRPDTQDQYYIIVYNINDIRYEFCVGKDVNIEYDKDVIIEKELLIDNVSVGLYDVPERDWYCGRFSAGKYNVLVTVWTDDIEKISFSYFSLGTLEEFLSDENLYFSNPRFDFKNMDEFMAFFTPDAETEKIPAMMQNHLNGSSDTPVSDVYTAFITEIIANKKIHIPSKDIEQIRLYASYRHGKPWLCYLPEQESELSAKIYIAYLTPEEAAIAENVTFEEFLYEFDSEYWLMYGFRKEYDEEIQLADRSVSAHICESGDQNACYVYFVYDNLLVNIELDTQQPDMEWLKTLSFTEYKT